MLREVEFTRYITPHREGSSLNVGLILFDRERQSLGTRVRHDREAIDVLRPGCDHEAIERDRRIVERIAHGDGAPAPFATMSQSGRHLQGALVER